MGAYPHPLVTAAWEDQAREGQHFELSIEVDADPEDDFRPIFDEAWSKRPAPRLVVRLPRADVFSLGALCGFFAVANSLNHRMGNIPYRL